LQQRSALHCQFAHRYVDAMVKNRHRLDDLIDVLVWIRRRVKRSAAKRKRAKTSASLNRDRRFCRRDLLRHAQGGTDMSDSILQPRVYIRLYADGREVGGGSMAATTPAVFKRGVTHYLKRLQRMYPNAREHEVKVMEAPV
jgi:hypothetical protein